MHNFKIESERFYVKHFESSCLSDPSSQLFRSSCGVCERLAKLLNNKNKLKYLICTEAVLPAQAETGCSRSDWVRSSLAWRSPSSSTQTPATVQRNSFHCAFHLFCLRDVFVKNCTGQNKARETRGFPESSREERVELLYVNKTHNTRHKHNKLGLSYSCYHCELQTHNRQTPYRCLAVNRNWRFWSRVRRSK